MLANTLVEGKPLGPSAHTVLFILEEKRRETVGLEGFSLRRRLIEVFLKRVGASLAENKLWPAKAGCLN